MRILVTGASGFIGSYAVGEFLKHGHHVLAVDLQQAPYDSEVGSAAKSRGEPPLTMSIGDVRDRTTVMDAMRDADCWLHLAGILGTSETVLDPYPAVSTNVIGGLNVLEAASHFGRPGVNIGVGNHWENNPYSISKSCIERFCEMYRLYRSLDVITVRAMNAYGAGQAIPEPYGLSPVRKIVPTFMCQALTGSDLEVFGDGCQVMDMIHVADLAVILRRAVEHVAAYGAVGTTIEAGTGRPTTVNEIAQTVLDCTTNVAPKPGRIRRLPMRAGETPRTRVLADTTTLESIGVRGEEMKSLELGIHETVDYYVRSLDGRTVLHSMHEVS